MQGTAESAEPYRGRLFFWGGVYVRIVLELGGGRTGGGGVTGRGDEADVVGHGRVVDERVGNHVGGLIVCVVAGGGWVGWVSEGRFLENWRT